MKEISLAAFILGSIAVFSGLGLFGYYLARTLTHPVATRRAVKLSRRQRRDVEYQRLMTQAENERAKATQAAIKAAEEYRRMLGDEGDK